MLALMKKGLWNTPTKRSGRAVVNEEFRQYWIAQNHRYRRRRLVERFGLSALAAVGGCAAVWAFLSYGPALPTLPSLSFGSSSSAAQVSVGPFRNCAAARAAGAAPLRWGQPGYAPYLDADGDGIACEWTWRSWFR
jgi:Excalibur calcium-binding domain